MRSGEIPLGKTLLVGRLIGDLKRIAWVLRKAGAGLVLVAILGVGWIYTPLIVAEINYKISNLQFTIPLPLVPIASPSSSGLRRKGQEGWGR